MKKEMRNTVNEGINSYKDGEGRTKKDEQEEARIIGIMEGIF